MSGYQRCNADAVYYMAKGGYRTCIEHATPGLWNVGTWGIGKCDQPLNRFAAMLNASRQRRGMAMPEPITAQEAN